MKKVKFRTVDTSTLKGVKTAERLKANGWVICAVGFWSIYFYKTLEDK